MADIVDPEKRSLMMSGIGGKNTKPELALRSELHKRGFRYRLHVKGLAGRPDLLLPRYRAAVFVHGCFWHRHDGCAKAASPKSRPDFWQDKFRENVLRDQNVVKRLRDDGWRVAVVWECGLSPRSRPHTASALIEWLRSDDLEANLPA